MLTVEFTVEDSRSGLYEHLAQNLADPTPLHVRAGERLEKLTRTYLRAQAVMRHKTADNLGARPTGILSRAAESPEGSGSRESARVTLRPAEVLGRAFRDVEITPREGKKYLTIPVAAAAYGTRAGEHDDLVFLRVGPKKTPVLAKRAQNGNLIIYFVLVAKVTQKQDRTLMPSDDAFLSEAEAAAEDVLLAGEGSLDQGVLS